MNASDQTTQATTITNPGQTLRQAREARGLTLAMVSQQLNIAERTLAQIEAGDFSRLPGHTFARGYVRAYAKQLGLDQTRLVIEFDQYTGTDASGSQVQSLGHIEEPVRLSSLGLRLASFAILLALGAGAFFLWQDSSTVADLEQAASQLGHIEVEGADGSIQIHPLDEPAAPADEAVVEPPAPAETAPVLAGTPPTDAPAAEGEVTAEGDAAPVAGEVALDALPVPLPADAPSVPSTPAASEAPASGQAAAEETPSAPVDSGAGQAVLRLAYSAECWTQVTDASGKVLLSALMPAGSRKEVQGEPPLSLVLGYSRGVEITYNGEPVDISPYRRGETARFKLGQ